MFTNMLNTHTYTCVHIIKQNYVSEYKVIEVALHWYNGMEIGSVICFEIVKNIFREITNVVNEKI